MRFEWNERKAARNLRLHGVSFGLAQAALETGLGVPIAEQFRNDEWRTKFVAPLRSVFLSIVVTVRYGDEDEFSDEDEELWRGGEAIVRIISARQASAEEQQVYFEARPAQGR